MARRIILIIISFGIVISLSSQDTDGDGYGACPSMNPDILITTSGTSTIIDTSTFIAGSLIHLNQKFSVDQGKVFEAQIGDCKN